MRNRCAGRPGVSVTAEALEYLVLAFLSSPVIHVVFSFLLGWKDYMPFIDVPALWEL